MQSQPEATLPSLQLPPWDRFAARDSPLSVVLKEATRRLGREDFRLVEDYRFSPMLWRLTGALIRRLPERSSLGTFFVSDREHVRCAILLRRELGSPTTYSRAELLRQLRRFLNQSGRSENESALALIDDAPLGVSGSFRWKPTVLIVWSGDRTPLESMLGLARDRLSPTLVRAFRSGDMGLPPVAGEPGAATRDGEVTAEAQPGSPATPATPADASATEVEPSAAVVPLDTTPAHSGSRESHATEIRSSISTARDAERTVVAQPQDARPSRFRRRVVGSTRGNHYRRLLLREQSYGKRVVMISAERRPEPSLEASFFDRVGYSGDAVRALREMSGTQELPVNSVAVELLEGGLFRAATCGVRPAFYRASQKRLVLFPDSLARKKGSTAPVIRGQLEKGDLLILLSRTPLRSELLALQATFQEAGGIPADEVLTARLDALGFGKTLTLSKSG